MPEERSTHIQQLRWFAHKAVKHAQHLLTTKRGNQFTPYQLGDKVWLEGTNLAISHSEKKFKPRRYSPFTITEVVSKVAYKLALPSHWKIHSVFHTSLLTPYHKTTMHRPNHHKPPLDIIDSEPEWEVEEILGDRTFGRRKEKQYKIRWKGYSPAHNTWEPASNIHAPELVKAYLRRRQTRDKNPTMSDDDLPVHLNLLAIDPNTTSQPSTPSAPSSVTIFMEMAARAGINVSEETAATITAIQQQEEATTSTIE